MKKVSVMGPLNNIYYLKVIAESALYAKYAAPMNPESAYELLTKRINDKLITEQEAVKRIEETPVQKKGDKSVVEQVMGATITRQIGKEIVRGLFGMLIGKKKQEVQRIRVFSVFKGIYSSINGKLLLKHIYFFYFYERSN